MTDSLAVFKMVIPDVRLARRIRRDTVERDKDINSVLEQIDTRNLYSQLELDEVQVEWAELLAGYI
ncbi:uridine kinase-like protein 2 [Cucumis melo var. makuwa]|uniref:Uridine kinase-like protein 2 n=1 Tax=Cucumis melo var. makuwa TaxID=1194695 RepID=A0A5A7UHM1_CUCMM|nr:uridine kinase-like protein 2 [Cucumis melo var. makuwa]